MRYFSQRLLTFFAPDIMFVDMLSRRVHGHVNVWNVLPNLFSSPAYVVGSQSFRPEVQKPRQIENVVRDI
jgi:hypothetical protein